MIKYILIFLTVVTHITYGQLKPFAFGIGTASSVSKYGIVERSFAQSGTYDNPYSEVYATAIFTSPSAVEDSVPMFWDGSSVWKFRFSPNEVGTWTWTTEATDAGLNGKSGSFTVTVGSKKGTIKKDPSYPYHFVRQNGSKFWFMGDTEWNLPKDDSWKEHDSTSTHHYIDLRASQGYNVITFVLNADQGWLDVNQNDMDTLNLTYWRNADDRLAYMNSKDMVGGVLMSWANERADGTWRDWDNFTTSEQRTRYLRYVIGRYSAYYIYWVLAGEYEETTTPVDWYALGALAKAYDPHNRMIAVHDANGTSEEFADESWFDFSDYQQQTGRYIWDDLVVARDHSKPLVNAENQYYKSDRDSDYVINDWYNLMPYTRTLTWRIAFAGGYFITGYGCTYLGGLRDPQKYTNMDSSKYDDWEAQVGYIKEFFADKEYWKLTPTDTLFSGGGNGDMFCLYENDRQYYYHVDSVDATLYADLTGASGIYNLRRLDTRTGAYTDLGQENGGGLVEMVVPDAQDYVFEFMLCDTCEYQAVDTTAYVATLYIDGWKDDGYFENAIDPVYEEEPLTGIGNSSGTTFQSFHRFSNFQAPRNLGEGYYQQTIIDSAWIYFKADQDRTTETCSLIVYIADSANSSQVTSASDFNGREGIGTQSWIVEPWYDGNWYRSPDLKTGIQALVNLSNWEPGNHVQVFLSDNGSDASARRRAFARDSAGTIASSNWSYLKIYYRTIDSVYIPDSVGQYYYDYYVDFTNGSDSNPGTIDLPLKTITKLNTMALAGKKIGFKRGETWVIDTPLLIENDDTGFGTDEADRTIFGAYGTGANPIINSRDSISGWSNGDNWTNEGGNEWSIPMIYVRPVLRMWIDGSEVMCGIVGGGVDADSVFLHYPDNKLYVYSATNPAETFTSMEIPSFNDASTFVRYTIIVDGTDYVTLENLDIRGGIMGSVGIKGADNLIIQNCNIGKDAGRSGILSTGDGLSSPDNTSDNVIIRNNTIYSEWIYPYWAYDYSTPYAVYITDGSDWSVYNNTITDWWFGIYVYQDATLISENHQIYNNNISSPNFSSSKGIQFFSVDNATNGYEMYLDIYNNYIHDVIVAFSFAAAENKVYYNIIDSMISGTNSHSYDNSGFSIEISHETWDADLGRNYIFNNTFYKSRVEHILYGHATYFINNLFLEPYESAASYITIRKYTFSSDTVMNNFFYKTGSNSSSDFIQLTGDDPDDFYSISELNAIGGKISGNIYPISNSSVAEIMNADFTLPSGSEALNAGVDIDALLPDGFTDREDNVVNQAAPNIGAIDNVP